MAQAQLGVTLTPVDVDAVVAFLDSLSEPVPANYSAP
jgi:hypothetical protein